MRTRMGGELKLQFAISHVRKRGMRVYRWGGCSRIKGHVFFDRVGEVVNGSHDRVGLKIVKYQFAERSTPKNKMILLAMLMLLEKVLPKVSVVDLHMSVNKTSSAFVTRALR